MVKSVVRTQVLRPEVVPIGVPLERSVARSVNRSLWPLWLLLGLGLGLRFANLTEKPIWIDEAFTLFHVSGVPQAVAMADWVTGRPVDVATLLTAQRPHPAYGLGQMVANIADRAPELPPFYFGLLRGWMQMFGGSVWAARSLSAVLSLATFPVMYALCLELFGLPIVGWYGMALMGLSPFQLNMAQEVRPYSLWTLVFLGATLLFWRSRRTGRWRDWAGFAGVLLVGLYTHLFMLLPWLVYGLHSVMMARGPQGGRSLKQFVMVSGVVLLGFMPWIWVGFWGRGDREAAFTVPYDSGWGVVKGILQGFGRFFVDFSVGADSPRWAVMAYGVGVVAVVGLALYAWMDLWRHDARARGAAGLLGLLVLVPVGLFAVTDLLTHASRTALTRYYIPSAIAVEVAIAYWLAAQQTGRFTMWQPPDRRWLDRGLVLLLVGALSCGWFVRSPTWWSKTQTGATACVAEVMRAEPTARLLSDRFFMQSLALAHALPETVTFQLYPVGSRPPQSVDLARSTFLYLPSAEWLAAMQADYAVTSTCQADLWAIKSRRRS